MLTTSTRFAGLKDKFGAFEGWIVRISKGAVKHYYSNVTMHLHDDDGNAIVVYPCLSKHTGIFNQFNIILGTWAVASVGIALDNLRYQKEAPGSQSLSDVLTPIEGEEVVIYAVKGNISSTDTSEQSLVKKFVGYVSQPIRCNDNVLTIRASSKSGLNKRALPPDEIETDYPNAPAPEVKPVENYWLIKPEATRVGSPRIPIVYGAFTHSADIQQGLGLAVAVPIDKNERKASVIADRPIFGIYSYWFTQESIDRDKVDGFQWFAEPQANLSDNGRSTIAPSDQAHIRLYPSGSSLQVDDPRSSYFLTREREFSHVIPVTGIFLLSDRDDDTFTSILDSADYMARHEDKPSPLVKHVTGRGCFTFPDLASGAGDDVGNAIGRISGEATIDILCNVPDDITLKQDPWVRIFFGRHISDMDKSHPCGYVTPGDHDTVTFDLTETSDSQHALNYAQAYGWEPSHNKITHPNEDVQGEFFPFMVVISVMVENATDIYDTIINNHQLLNVHSLFMILSYEPVDIDTYWVECSGIMFDPWIEADGRDNDYFSGEVIEDPVYICEDLLRYYGGLDDDDIDTASFDAAANSGIKARLNLHKGNESDLNSVIRKLCEQSTARFCYTSASVARMVSLSDDDPTTDRIIPLSHIKAGKISISKTRKVYNSIEASSGWREEVGNWRSDDFYTVTNDVSVAQYGESRCRNTWKNIEGDSVRHVVKRLIGDGAGGDIDAAAIWARRHAIIELETVGFIGMDLELGDYIELEAASVDPNCKLFDQSWSGIQFMIFAVNHGMNSSRIKAIRLYEDPLMIWDGLWIDDDTSPLTSTLDTNIPALHDGDKTVEACYYFPYPDTCSWSVGADFGRVRSVSRLKLYDDPSYANHPADTGSGWGGIYPTGGFDSLEVYTSNDNANWTLKETIHPVPREPEGHQYPCSIDLTLSGTYECRYIKLHCDLGQLAAVNGGPIGISEIEAYDG